MTRSGVSEPRPQRALEAVAFDLYGTLLALDDPLLHRQVPRLLGISGRRWVELVRSHLLTTAFPDTRRLAEFVCRALGGDRWEALVDPCARAVKDELASVRLLDGVVPLLHFLKRRGLKLGLISNVSSAHKTPVGALGLDALFDAAVFSCDEGRMKPDPELYRELCRRLGADTGSVLVVGDSLPNDVAAPAALGMKTAWVAPAGRGGAAEMIADVAWFTLAGAEPQRSMLRRGQALPLEGGAWTVTALRPVSEGAQGRYNLVYEVECEAAARGSGAAQTRVVYAKRYLAPESAYVEDLAYRVQGLAGLPTCETHVVGEDEPFLLVSRAPGTKYAGELDPAVAYELGRQFAFGYIFSNADLRPRNAFVSRGSDGGAAITMVDLEHCFFNLAIDVASLPDPTTPEAIDGLGAETLRRLTKKRVLTEKTLPRARGEFFDVRTAASEAIRAYGEGFLAAYGELGRRAEAICAAIRGRLAQRPYLVIGTRGYRRVMAEFDVADIAGRLSADPRPILDQLLAHRS
ncbi:MAG TPA: HAD family hydrolase [Thermoanaerobaculaceae bacterium]|nr:HAD family hydrolase [Thermoanaerobaculaceae bacterium]